MSQMVKAKASVYRPTASSRKLPPPQSDIALRAYEIYVARGAEPGREIDDWLQAESELMGRSRIAPRRSASR